MSAAKIQGALDKAFAQRRVVFWYDEAGEWWPEFDAMHLSDVERISVQNTEFAVKHRISRELPEKKFLLYFRSQAQPPDTANWLLDQLLAYGPAFSPDRASLALIDAGLPPEFKSLTEKHLEFFRSIERVSRLKEWLMPDDTEQDVRLKMIAVICKSQPAVETVLLVLLTDLANSRDDRFALIEKYGLSSAWWQEIASQFGYVAAQASLKDFVLSLFRAVTPLGGGSSLNVRQSLIFFNRWKDSQEHRETFEVLSDQTAKSLNISAALNQVEDIGGLLENDTYRLIDQRLLTYLRDGLMDGCLAPSLVRQRAEQRARLHWARYDAGIQALYRTIASAAEFIDLLPKLEFTIESFDAGLEKYAATWWRMDQLYRKFIFYVGESSQPTLLGALAVRIEGLYVNEYLSKLAYRWQEWVDRLNQWSSSSTPSQKSFFTRFVQPHLAEGKKVFVVISDALRYEAAKELLERILAQDRWTGEIKASLGSLPSFTQLGMAALLPQSSLELSKDGQTVLADGVSTMGTEARAQILSRHLKGRGTALRADEFLAMNSKTEGRDLSKANDVVFIYHNEIDAVGDKRDTEHRTCAAVESAIENVVKILKKAAAMNVTYMVVTADHGFLYQHEPVAESDFLNSPQVSETVKIDRRSVVTSQLSNDPKLRNFTAAQLGLKGASHLSFPKGTLRLRLQGSGSRYVHGGTSLQEVVVPVIEVKKERASDVGSVQVDILRSSQQITTGQVTVTFLQNEPVSDKCLGRELRAAFYSKTDVPLSDIKVLSFVATDEDARLRERSERFIFSRAADAFNQQDVVLRLVEQVAGTTQFALYKEFVFRLRRAFESDFDEL